MRTPGAVLAAASVLALTGCEALDMARASVHAQADAPHPIPSAASAPVGRQDREARAAWGRRQLMDAYGRVGRHDPRWDAAARDAIETSLGALTESTLQPPSAEARVEAGRAAVAAGCDDPLVLLVLARAVRDLDALSGEPEELLIRSVEGMKTVPYARAIAREAASSLYDLYAKRIEGMGLREPLAALERRWFEESLSDGSYGPDEDVVLAWQLLTDAAESFRTRALTPVSAAVGRAPWVDPWLKHLVSGMAHRWAAWQGRGTGFAKDVTAEGLAIFRREGALARRDLEASWRLRPDRPETAVRLISLASDDPKEGETERLWFDRAIAAQLDYLPAYETLTGRLLPRWGGSYEAMLSLGSEALDTGRFDTAVPAQLLEIVHRIRQDQRAKEGGAGGRPVFERPAVYASLVRVFEGYLAEPSRAGEQAAWHAQWAVAADRAGRPAEAVSHLEAAGWHLAPPARRFVVRENETPRDFMDRVTVAASPASADVANAARLGAAFDVAGALEAYRAAARKDPSARLARAIGGPVAALELEQRLADGGWVPFLPTTVDLAGWRAELGEWHLDPDGALLGRAGSRGLLLVSDARVGAHFEARGRLELVSSTNGSFQGGLAFGRPSWTSKDWIAFRVKRNAREGRVAYFSCHFEAPFDTAIKAKVEDANVFTVRVEGGRLSATVNGATLQEGMEPPRGLVRSRDLLVGLGGYVDENVVSLRFRDVELRRLRATP